MNLAILLTWFRIVAVPGVVAIYLLPVPWAQPAAGLLFAAAALTDWLDGWVARRFDQGSRFGAFLDPVADKLLVIAALLVLVQSKPSVVLVLVAIVIIGREVAVSALREWMAVLGKRGRVDVIQLAKYKSILQMVALSCMLYEAPLWILPVYPLGYALLLISAALTLLTGALYMMRVRGEMRPPLSETG
ncbi:CDP-diacylglycerol--glycerol-3-phosphate 3-phosphatidyltransferase [Candidatus Foliamicus sp.]